MSSKVAKPEKRIAIVQSNYIPWRGYFDLISSVDHFIIYDDVQFTKNDWRNRNLIKTPQGTQWLTIPVGKKIHRLINEVHLPSTAWQVKHWKTLESNYGRSKYFSEISSWLKPLYLKNTYQNLSEMNVLFIRRVCEYLSMNTTFHLSSDFTLSEGQTERLVDLCVQLDGTAYVTGPAAKDYLNESLFLSKNIEVEWFQYPEYPKYQQLWKGEEYSVSILDVLFNCGPESMKYISPSKQNWESDCE